MVVVRELGCSLVLGLGQRLSRIFSQSNSTIAAAEVSRDTRALAAETAALELGMGNGLGRIKWRTPES